MAAVVENTNYITPSEDIIPLDIRVLYENKPNIIFDRFTPAIGHIENDVIFIIQIKDFGGNVGRTHIFQKDQRDIYDEMKHFLIKWGLQMVTPYNQFPHMEGFE